MPLYSQAEKEAKRLQQMSVSVANEQPGISNMLEGQQQLSVIGGVVTDVKKVNDDLYHNRLFRSFEEQVDTILNEESVIKVQHKFTGNPVFDPGFQSDTFSSGFTGNGMKLNKDSVNDYNFELDNLIVRGTMSVYELLIQQIRATNGGIFVTSSAKVESSSSLSASDDSGTITFDDPSGTGLCPFADGDIIMMQRVNPNATVAKNATSGFVKKLVYEVISVSGATATVNNTANTQFDNASYPVKGDEFVRIGNTGDTANRDGVIYITSDDSNSPFMEIFDSINSYSEWTTAVPKVRLGRLDGITDTDAGLSGSQSNSYGLYSDSVHLKGHIHATSGSFTGSLSVGANDNIFRVNTDGDMWIGDATQGDAPFQVDNEGVVIAKKITVSSPISSGGTYFNLEQSGHATFGAGNFKISNNGNVHIQGNADNTGTLYFHENSDTKDYTGDAFRMGYRASSDEFVINFNANNRFELKESGNLSVQGTIAFGDMSTDDCKFERASGDGIKVYMTDADGSDDGTANGAFYPAVNDDRDLGHASYKWDNVYATNGTIQTSDRNEKESIQTSTLGLNFISALNPVSYVRKGKTRSHYGLIAQEVKTVLDSLSIDASKFAGYVNPSSTGGEGALGLRYHEFIAPMIKAIQELKAEVEELKNSS